MMNKEVEFWEMTAAYRRFQNHKLCVAETSVDPCKSPIIHAHTIPRSQLKKIAREGHVYARPSVEDMMKSEEMPLLKLTGIGKFSALNCFCARHDKSLFSDIEDIPLVFSPRQLALLHYRTVALEFYKKLGADKGSTHGIEKFSKRPNDVENSKRVDFLRTLNEGERIALRDGRSALDRCTNILDDHAYLHLSALVVYFKRLPSVMTVGGFYPEYDFKGRLLQNLGRAELDNETLSFNILAAEGRAAVAIIWEKGHERCLAFAKSYVEQREEHYATLVIQAAFEHIDVCSPSGGRA